MASSRSKAKTRVCRVGGCSRPAFCRERCQVHYNQLRRMNEAARAAELAKPVPEAPKWEYEPSPDQVAELIEKYGEQIQ
jgi:hypothetical protein